MNKKRTFFVWIVLLLCISNFSYAQSTDEIKQILIERSISLYPGNCPCPYNHDRAGRKCGKRSAYLRRGGYAPLCYPDDITQEMIEEYKQMNDKNGNEP